MLDENARRALVAAYYLSRFDSGYQALGFETMTAAHQSLGAVFGLTGDAIKNRRDEFDPIHDNHRAGWHQREMRPSRAAIVEQFAGVSEPALRALIQSWLRSEEVALPPLAAIVDEADESGELTVTSGSRTVTGRRAEEYYRDQFSVSAQPCGGDLVDMRESGQGYDFVVSSNGMVEAYVEVKGLAGHAGSITLTAREWQAATELGDRYHLILVRNVYSEPTLSVLTNPASVLQPTLRLTSVVQETWTVHSARLFEHSVPQWGRIRGGLHPHFTPSGQ